jgi:hypothetical protein
MAFDFADMGRYDDIISLLSGRVTSKPQAACSMIYYVLGYYSFAFGGNGLKYYELGDKAKMGNSYPERLEEKKILEDVILRRNSSHAKMLLGCLCYNKLRYERAAELWKDNSDYISVRNLAVAYFSHLGWEKESLELMKKAQTMRPDDEQLVYETVLLMNKIGVCQEKKTNFY